MPVMRLETSIKLHETDAAGLLFFGHQFKLAHDAYELLMEKIGFSFARVFDECDFLLPIVHAEADYLAPLYVGDRLTVIVSLAGIGESSFTLEYDFQNTEMKSVGKVTTVHVCVDKKNRKKRLLPEAIRAALQMPH
jgi:YbgC/YbaW family acyl-CoA thioester hydrolase